jgi:uncharacterized protein YggU (UPF0235/DUF167 family)
MGACAVRVAAGGVRVAVRLRPAAGRNRIEGIADGPDGGRALRISVTAPPEAGKANAALIGLLAKAWHLPKSTMRVASGARADQEHGHHGRRAGAEGPHRCMDEERQ